MLILKKPWESQPQIPWRIEQSHDLIQGKLRAVFCGEQIENRLGALVPTFFGPIQRKITLSGIGIRSEGSTTVAAQGVNCGAVSIANTGWTIATILTPVNYAPTSDPCGMIGVQDGVGGATWDRALAISSAAKFKAYLFDGASKTVTAASAVSAREYRVVVTTDGATLWLYVDGTLEGSVSVSNDGFSGYSNPVFTVGGFTTTISSARSNDVSYALFVGVAWSAEKVQRWTKNPWQVFEPQNIHIPVSITSGGAYTLNLETGSYSFTGSDAVLLKNSQLTLDSGSYSLTGSNASLLKGLILEASSGTYTLSGSDASLLYTHLLSASSGTYTINGADATLTYTPTSGAYTLNAESGTYLLTGSDVTFIYSGSEVTIKAGSWIRYRIIT